MCTKCDHGRLVTFPRRMVTFLRQNCDHGYMVSIQWLQAINPGEKSPGFFFVFFVPFWLLRLKPPVSHPAALSWLLANFLLKCFCFARTGRRFFAADAAFCLLRSDLSFPEENRTKKNPLRPEEGSFALIFYINPAPLPERDCPISRLLNTA